MNKIEELEEKFHAEICNLSEKFDKEISELKEKQENQEWVPQMNERYWTIDLNRIIVMSSSWDNAIIDNTRLKRKVIFKTKDEAKEYLEYLKAKEKAMNEFSNAEWEDEDINKYYIYYDCEDNFFRADYSYYCRRINEMYFRTKESAQEFIDKYEKHLRRELCV